MKNNIDCIKTPEDIDWAYFWSKKLTEKEDRNKDWNKAAPHFAKSARRDEYHTKLLEQLNITKEDIVRVINEFKNVLNRFNPSEIILLDISRVGTGSGFNEDLLNEFSSFKDKIIIGGGIGPDDLVDLDRLGFSKALIGTSLHNGEIKISHFSFFSIFSILFF